MSKSAGIMYTCDRCGATGFAQLLGTEELDGGRTHYEKHEKLKGWFWESEMGDLCPNCANEFKRFVTEFMDGKVAPSWKYDGPFLVEKEE